MRRFRAVRSRAACPCCSAQTPIINGVLTRAVVSAYRHPVFGSCESGAFVVFYDRSRIVVFPGSSRDTAARRSRKARQYSHARAGEEAGGSPRACARRSSLQGHRAGAAVDGLPRLLRRHRKVSVDEPAVDRDHLDPLRHVRADVHAGDAAGLAAACDAHRSPRPAIDARRRRCSAPRCSSSPVSVSSPSRKPRPPASSRRCSSPRCRSSS